MAIFWVDFVDCFAEEEAAQGLWIVATLHGFSAEAEVHDEMMFGLVNKVMNDL